MIHVITERELPEEILPFYLEWENKSDDYVIVWHDICDSCPSAMKALAKFSEEIDTPVYRLWDSHCARTYRRNS